jgi:hypothetical protein
MKSPSRLASARRAANAPRADSVGASPIAAAPQGVAAAIGDLARLARAATTAPPGEDGEKTVPDVAAREANARLEQAIAALEREMALKLWILVVAGKEARDLSLVLAGVPQRADDPGWPRQALLEQRDQLGDCLQRGAAIACATRFDLELPVTKWPTATQQDLEGRAWASFGRQLATAPPSAWRCFAVVDPRARTRITKLYLSLTDQSWWSFRRLLDRPSAQIVSRERKRTPRGSVTDVSIEAIASRSGTVQGEALQRALASIRARLGIAATHGSATPSRSHA